MSGAWILSAAPEPVNEPGWRRARVVEPVSRKRAAGRVGVATKAEVERQLGALMARLDGNEANVRSAIPSRKVLRCAVPDLDATWFSVVENGHVSQPTEPSGSAPTT